MDPVMKQIHTLRKAIEKMAQQLDCIGDAVANELLLQAIFSDEPPKHRTRQRTASAQATE